jgi:hypothetical protein
MGVISSVLVYGFFGFSVAVAVADLGLDNNFHGSSRRQTKIGCGIPYAKINHIQNIIY